MLKNFCKAPDSSAAVGRLIDSVLTLDCTGLNTSQQQDLADVLPYLACGEASAVHAFTGRLCQKLPEGTQATLRAIAQDEMAHARLIEALQASLPSPQQAPHPARVAMFFRKLESSQPAEHLAHIAALDRAVCQLLHPLLATSCAISRSPNLHRALCALRQDEARHVNLARSLARQMGMSQSRQSALNRDIRQRLQWLLQPVSSALGRLAMPCVDQTPQENT